MYNEVKGKFITERKIKMEFNILKQNAKEPEFSDSFTFLIYLAKFTISFIYGIAITEVINLFRTFKRNVQIHI